MNCCSKKNEKRKREGFLSGLIYGLVPHIGCIAFIVFSVLGVTTATALFKPLLLNPYFFYILIAISLVFSTFSAIFYFKQQGFISFNRISDGLEISFLPSGLKRKWKYLSILYGTTISINLLLFMIIFPIAANVGSGASLTASLLGAFGGGEELQLSDSASLITLQVAIPCPGHAPLITGELKKINGVKDVKFRFPNLFDVNYDLGPTTKEEILSLNVFNTYKATVIKATVINEQKGEADEQLINNPGITQPLPGGCGGGEGGCGCGCGR